MNLIGSWVMLAQSRHASFESFKTSGVDKFGCTNVFCYSVPWQGHRKTSKLNSKGGCVRAKPEATSAGIYPLMFLYGNIYQTTLTCIALRGAFLPSVVRLEHDKSFPILQPNGPSRNLGNPSMQAIVRHYRRHLITYQMVSADWKA